MSHVPPTARAADVAVVGYDGRFPGADDPRVFWANLRDARSSIVEFTEDELVAHGTAAAELRNPKYVRAGAVLKDVEYFDAAFFGFTAREAELMDPQQRIFLEVCWTALEHAGYSPAQIAGRVAVFAGARTNTYLLQLAKHDALVASVGPFHIGLGNDLAFLPARVSHCFNLTGPSCAVHTACSTSLVAVHLAIQSLRRGECEMALAGGVAINVPHVTGYVVEDGSVLSPNGSCRAFDGEARGTVFGSGAGVVVLKRLAEARAHGDCVHAVIRGSAVNNDGAHKASFTAPAVRGQVAVLTEALRDADVAADSIGYIEGHGTGTLLGDAIELRAMTKAFERATTRRGFCAVGSVKSNIGHLDAAAGIASLIKVVESLKHGELVPTLHYHSPNPQVDLTGSPFYVNTTRQDWVRGAAPRRAGVSAFGVGGTNAHVILEEAPSVVAAREPQSWQVLVWSAKSAAARDQIGARLVDYLRETPDVSLADVAYTLQTGRQRMAWRRAVVCRDAGEAATAIDAGTLDADGDGEDTECEIVFAFPGQGAQRPGMGDELYGRAPVYRDAIDRCAALLRPHLDADVRELLRSSDDTTLANTSIAQPVLFACEYALAQLWLSWGITPVALLGHSLGEYVAACLAGVLTLEDALRLVSLRGRLAQTMPCGAMLAVEGDASSVSSWLGADVWVTAINGAGLCTIGGTMEGIARVESILREKGCAAHRLSTSHAYHTPLLAPMVEPFVAAVAETPRAAARIPYVSSVTGTWITDEEIGDPAYWGRQLLEPVQLADGVRTTLNGDAGRVVLEVGPGTGVTGLVRRSGVRAWPSLGRGDRESMELMRAVAQLWVAGASVDWAAVAGPQPRRRLPLPTYPFQRQRYWVDPPARSAVTTMAIPESDSVTITKSADVTRWFWVPTWHEVVSVNGNRGDHRRQSWLVLARPDAVSEAVAGHLIEAGAAVAIAVAGEGFARTGPRAFVIDPASRDDYRRLAQALADAGIEVDRVLHMLSTEPEHGDVVADDVAELIALLDASRELCDRHRLRAFHVVGSQTLAVERGDLVSPARAAAVAFCKILPQETGVEAHFVDVACDEAATQPKECAKQVLAALSGTARVVAVRGGRFWVPRYEHLRFDEATPAPLPLRDGGVYLITGGMGAVGLMIARQLAEDHRARLVLTGRTPAAGKADSDAANHKVAALRAIEAAGGAVRTIVADVTDEAAMRAAVDLCVSEFGALHGVVHAAGVTSGPSLFRTIRETEPEHCRAQLGPKLRGLTVLERVLGDRPLDFVLAMSSNAAVLGGLGFLAYAAANATMDAFVMAKRSRSSERWLSANWDHWPEETRKYTGMSTSMDAYAMSEAEARDATRLVLTRCPAGQVVVATADLQRRLELWLEQATAAPKGDAETAPARAATSRPRLRTEYVAPRTEMERHIAAIWEDYLSVSPIGIHDDFFELGGHSLIALKMVAEVGRAVGNEIPLRALFEGPTVAQLAVCCGSPAAIAPTLN